jgi:hypothetical protein
MTTQSPRGRDGVRGVSNPLDGISIRSYVEKTSGILPAAFPLVLPPESGIPVRVHVPIEHAPPVIKKQQRRVSGEAALD